MEAEIIQLRYNCYNTHTETSQFYFESFTVMGGRAGGDISTMILFFIYSLFNLHPESKSVVFTVSDAMFAHLVTSDQTYHVHHGVVVDPFQLEPVLQRLVLMTQLVTQMRITMEHLNDS